MKIDKRLIAVTLCGLAVSILLAFASELYVQNIKKTVDLMIQKNLFNIKSALMVNINFLRARRAEKNLLIYKNDKEMYYQYKDQLDTFMQEVDSQLRHLEHNTRDQADNEFTIALNNNIADYKELMKGFISSIDAKKENPGELEVMLDKLRQINDALADNIMYIYTKNSDQIADRYNELQAKISDFKNFVRVFLLISIIAGYATAVFFVRVL